MSCSHSGCWRSASSCITKTQHSRNCFPDEFEENMSDAFKIRLTIRKRPRDSIGRVSCKGSRVIVEHAGKYMEKVCESLHLPREWYVVSFGAR